MRHLTSLGAALTVCAAVAAESPAVKSFRVQKTDDATYFRVEFVAPPHVADQQSPRLVPQDDATRAVVRDGLWDLVFVGKWSPAADRANFRMMYTVRAPGRPPAGVELPVTLKRSDAGVENGDLKRLWANARMAEFGRLRKLAPDFNFYPLAQLLVARKYGLTAPADLTQTQPSMEAAHRQMFETYTGGAAVAESLQLHRLIAREARGDEGRVTSVSDMPGINIPEHPWAKMMGDDRPAPEPFARLIPADNYYVRFRDPGQLLAFGELLDQWGTNLIHAFEFQDRDAFVRARYERQLCLPSARLAKAIRPEWVKGVAITGSDPYLADGSDVTVIIQTLDPKKLLLELDAFIHEAHLAHHDGWSDRRSTFLGTAIESYTTTLREVSLHRAAVGDHVIYSNSRVALERVLSANKRSIKPLSESLDFQYMRTVFRGDDTSEDGFAFLPDAFIRRMMGPADKIKQRRRAEALGRIALTHTAALFAGWDTGTVPADLPGLLAATGLKADDLTVAEGRPIVWDGPGKPAYSDVYNTLTFATPLIELEIDKVTPRERDDYESFRRDYLRLWGQFFDPVGMRFRNGEKQVQLEAYVLPLIQSDRYRLMRQVTGGEPYPFDPARTPPNTLMQLQVKLGDSGPGTWLTLRIEDDPAFAKRMDLLLRRERDPAGAAKLERELERTFWRLPLVLGIGVAEANSKDIDGARNFLREQLTRGEPKTITHRDVAIQRYEIDPEKARQTLGMLRSLTGAVSGSDTTTLAALISFLPEKEMPEAIYQAFVGDGYFLSLREDCLNRLIDHEEDRRKGRVAKAAPVPANASLFVAPSAPTSSEAIRHYLEYQTHKRALADTAVWLPLHRAGVIPPNATEAEERAAALRWYGFEPISPDGAGFRYDRRRDEVVNTRHGSPRDPVLRPTLAPDAPVRRLMEQFRTVRTDLRFREDGIHTTVTFERIKWLESWADDAQMAPIISHCTTPAPPCDVLARVQRGLMAVELIQTSHFAKLVESSRPSNRAIGRCHAKRIGLSQIGRVVALAC